MVALTRDGKRAYTSNVHVGTVSAIDLAAKKVPAVIPVSPYAQRIALSRTTAGPSPPTRRSRAWP